MAKKKLVPFRVEEEWFKALSGLAGTFGVAADEVIRQALPDLAVTRLFFQCRIYFPELRWDEVADVGREAVRKHLRAKYMEGVERDLARFGVTIESSADAVRAAKEHALEELKADKEHPLACQLARAEEDSLYLGCLYEAWQRARAGQPGYAIAEVEIETPAGNRSNATAKVWAVLKDGMIV